MFSWLKKLFAKPSALPSPRPGPPPGITGPPKTRSAGPKLAPGNPGQGHALTLSVDGPAGQRTEKIDLTETLARVLAQKGRRVTRHFDAVHDEESGLQFFPNIASFQPDDDLSMQMCTTIEIRHPGRLPIAFFEYQHSHAATGEEAVTRGFQGWADLDLPVILDSLETEVETCTAMMMEFPNGRRRRVVFGPVSRTKVGPDAPPVESPEGGAVPHPPACPCCLFTNAGHAFKHFVESEHFHALRLLALRDPNGAPSADCRVNGEEYDEGKAALAAYAARWPFNGVEMWKQYVIVQDWPKEK
jgi:hypothetical protein